MFPRQAIIIPFPRCMHYKAGVGYSGWSCWERSISPLPHKSTAELFLYGVIRSHVPPANSVVYSYIFLNKQAPLWLLSFEG
jgi:hypothetical protein